MADNGDEKHDELIGLVEAVAAKAKKKRLTPEERLAEMEKKIREAAQKAANRAKATQARRNAKKTNNKSKRNGDKQALRNRISDALMEKAQQHGYSFTANDIKIPKVGMKMNHLNKYFNASKKKYYTRSKKPVSIQHRALEEANAQGINSKYVKVTTRNKSVSDIIEKARKRMALNTKKHKRSGEADAIFAFAQETLGLNKKDTQSVVCVREKKPAAK